jgi:ADP-heptose:LPS heptosyltransferase
MASKKNLNLYIELMRSIKPSSYYLIDNYSSKVCKERLCKEHSVLNEKYCVLVPFTTKRRFLSDLDLQEATEIIKSWGIPVVILSGDKVDINLKGIDVLNLSGKTSVFESIQITKNASGYIGIDSFLSLIASETLPHNNIIVKTKMIGINHKYYYNKVKDVNKIMYKNLDYIKYQNNK